MNRQQLENQLNEINSFDTELVLKEAYKFRVKSFLFVSIDDVLCSLDSAIRKITYDTQSLNLESDIDKNIDLQKRVLKILFNMVYIN